MLETIIPLKEIKCYMGTDVMRRNYVAGKSGSGVSTVLKGIAVSQDLRYIGEENLKNFNFPMTCQDLLNTLQMSGEVKGIVLDFPLITRCLTDFKNTEWNIPIWYSVQLRADGTFSQSSIDTYRLGRISMRAKE